MRNMSFFYTQEQIKNRSKTVTRRLGWKFANPGMVVRAVKKCQGLKKGEKIEPLAILEIKSVRREPLYYITSGDLKKEGFGDINADDFIDMFCKHMGCFSGELITRIEFKYL